MGRSCRSIVFCCDDVDFVCRVELCEQLLVRCLNCDEMMAQFELLVSQHGDEVGESCYCFADYVGVFVARFGAF